MYKDNKTKRANKTTTTKKTKSRSNKTSIVVKKSLENLIPFAFTNIHLYTQNAV